MRIFINGMDDASSARRGEATHGGAAGANSTRTGRTQRYGSRTARSNRGSHCSTRRVALTAALFLASIGTPAAAQIETVGTTGSWDGLTAAPTLSRDFFASAIGQSFTAPHYAAWLTSFTFFVGYSPFLPPADMDLQYRGYVMGWNGAGVTDLVFRSEVRAGSTLFGALEPAPFSPGVLLSPNAQYLAFLSTHEADPFNPFDPFAVSAYQNVGVVTADAYTGGSIVQSQATDFAALTAGAWAVDPGADLAFEAEFVTTSVPEPGSLILLLTGILGMWLVRRPGMQRPDHTA